MNPNDVYDEGEVAWSPTWDCRFDVGDVDPVAAAAQYDGGDASFDVSIVLSSFSGWIPGP